MPCARLRSSCTASCRSAPIWSSIALAGVGIGVGELAGEAHAHRQRDEVLLRAVVQVALDAAALGVGRPRRCGRATARSSSAWRRTSSSDSCSAESSFTLCSASPTWRASSVSAWSSSSLNGSAPCGAAHDDQAEQLAGVGDRRDAQHRVVVGRRGRAGSQTCAHAGPDTPARATTVSSSAPSAMRRAARGRAPTPRARAGRRDPRPHLGDARASIVFFSDSASWSSSSSSGSARVSRLPNVRSTSSGACRSP